jgi:hypothetical protein
MKNLHRTNNFLKFSFVYKLYIQAQALLYRPIVILYIILFNRPHNLCGIVWRDGKNRIVINSWFYNSAIGLVLFQLSNIYCAVQSLHAHAAKIRMQLKGTSTSIFMQYACIRGKSVHSRTECARHIGTGHRVTHGDPGQCDPVYEPVLAFFRAIFVLCFPLYSVNNRKSIVNSHYYW